LFFFSESPPPAVYSLSLHDALPILLKGASAAAIYGGQAANGVVIITTRRGRPGAPRFSVTQRFGAFDVENHLGSRIFQDSVAAEDRKSTRLNSSHRTISYAVFCLKK